MMSRSWGRCVHTLPEKIDKKKLLTFFLETEAKFLKAPNFPINLKLCTLSLFLSDIRTPSGKKVWIRRSLEYFRKMGEVIWKTMSLCQKIVIFRGSGPCTHLWVLPAPQTHSYGWYFGWRWFSVKKIRTGHFFLQKTSKEVGTIVAYGRLWSPMVSGISLVIQKKLIVFLWEEIQNAPQILLPDHSTLWSEVLGEVPQSSAITSSVPQVHICVPVAACGTIGGHRRR